MAQFVSQILLLALSVITPQGDHASAASPPDKTMLVSGGGSTAETAERTVRSVEEWRDKGVNPISKRGKSGLRLTSACSARALLASQFFVFAGARYEPAHTLESQSISLRI
jgi:hypothetical protein